MISTVLLVLFSLFMKKNETSSEILLALQRFTKILYVVFMKPLEEII